MSLSPLVCDFGNKYHVIYSRNMLGLGGFNLICCGGFILNVGFMMLLVGMAIHHALLSRCCTGRSLNTITAIEYSKYILFIQACIAITMLF